MASYGIVKISDFKGTLFIQKSVCENNLQAYIDDYESKYLNELLGIEKADLLVADLVDGVPQDPEILAWFNPFSIEEKNCYTGKVKVLTSEGVVKMLSYLIYFEFVKGEEFNVMLSGLTRSESENSQEKDSEVAQAFIQNKAWNRAVDTWRAIDLKECLPTDFKKMFI